MILKKKESKYMKITKEQFLNDVEKHALDSKKDSVLVKGLSLSELESLMG